MRHGDLLAQTDWSAVEHAYAGDPDVPSTPEILAALLTGNAGSQGRALHALHDDRWGVTDSEMLRGYRCDDFVVSPVLRAWRGVHVAAPAEVVWPWSHR